MTDLEKQQARDRAKQYAELQEIAYVDPFPEEAGSGEGNQPPAAPQLSNDDLMNALKERGILIANLDDLKPKPTEEELEAAKQKRQNDMIKYGIETGKFNKDDYDSYQRVSANKIGMIKEEVISKLTLANPELSAEAIEEKAATYLFEHLDETDPLRLQREQELAELADNRLQNKFKNILSLESDFEQHEQGLNNKANFERKVQATLPVYQKDVKTVLSGLASRVIMVEDNQNPKNNVPVTVKFSDADLKEIEDAFLTSDVVIRNIKEGIGPDAIREMAEQMLVKKHLPRLIAQAAKDYNSAQKDLYTKGIKGMIPERGLLDISSEDVGSGPNAEI